jgi:DUF4097 and DUF4098 domain-containing protein YvlB
MKKIALLRVFLVFGASLGVIAVSAQQEHEPFMAKTFPRGSVKNVEAETSGGNISVVGSSTGDARVEVYIHDNNHWNELLSKEEIQKRLDEQFDLKVDLDGDKIVAIAKQKEHSGNWRHSLSISFRIYTPEAVSTHLRTSGGNIDMKDLTGNENFHTSGGNLSIEHLSGTIVGRTSGGNVDIKESHDDIDLETSGGNMDAEHCEGKIRLGTSGGNVTLHNLKGNIVASTSGGEVKGGQISGDLVARTSGGNVDLDQMSVSLKASTSGGNIRVDFVTPGKFIDLSNSGGDISLEMPQGQGLDLHVSGDKVHSTAMTNFKGDMDEHHINGTLNGGGIPVTVDGNSGSVHLSFR